ncbi:high choriolytic enzyme 1-like [Labrus mixtus]|uniref:high choriolytic enzyme 1-like n=1 Tax=Labrus mixtus TaxID=508554 RepID=UPI0029BFD261|nr:high choriolytic enzyme 1-like [Labrus mixtus]
MLLTPGINHNLVEGDVALSKKRNAMKCWSSSCKWKTSSNGRVEVPYSLSDYFSLASMEGSRCFLCLDHGIIQHELLHALGFHHEHMRSDRDRYVWINWENIPAVSAHNFHKKDTNNLNMPYDYSSVMHYGRTAFASVYGADTITPIPVSSVLTGQRDEMSDIDIFRVNKLYNCNI